MLVTISVYRQVCECGFKAQECTEIFTHALARASVWILSHCAYAGVREDAKGKCISLGSTTLRTGAPASNLQSHRCIFFFLLVLTQCQGRQDWWYVINDQHRITVMGEVSGICGRQGKWHWLRSLGSCNALSSLGEYCDCSPNWSLK